MSEPRPLVSICISAYNVERYLAEALRSVLGQTYAKLEIIVLDNGSADRTLAVAESFHDPRLRSLRVPVNLGAYEAMNQIAGMASGQYIAIYHSDDVYERTIVEREVAHLTAHADVGAVFTTHHFMDEGGQIYGGVSLPARLAGRPSLTYDEIMTHTVRRKNALFCCPTFMVRREVLQAVGPFRPERYGIATDLEMWLRVARHFPIAILNERLVRYRRGPHQWSARYLNARTEPEAFFHVMDEYLAIDNWRDKLSREDLVEYAFHRGDDATFRAANLVRRGDAAAAMALLRAHPFPWRSLLAGYPRRKVRNLILRTMIRGGVALGAAHPLAAVLERIGP
jgi:glycosyltransferase involved in cell wall biosynthesis